MPRFSPLILLLCLAACTKPLPELEGLDTGRWKEDKNACAGKRALMEASLMTEKDKLKGLSEMDIVELLGKPDENELYKRNQKFFSYYVTPGPDCPDHEELPKKLVIRFNAMGYAQLVALSQAGQ
jgi:hypothetical protein